jgi:F-type H+-transporting ATPase subunit b
MDIQLPQIIFQVVNFGVVAVALTYLLYKPVKKMLDERSAKVEEAQKAAELTLAEKRQVDEMKKKAQKESEKDAAKLLEEAEKSAMAYRSEQMKKVKEDALKEVAKMKQIAESDIQAQAEHIKKEFNTAVLSTVEKIVGSLDKKAQEKLIDAELQQLLERI